jgi:hypothetical protein
MGTRLHLARRLDAATKGKLEHGLDYIGEDRDKRTMLLEAARCPQGGVFHGNINRRKASVQSHLRQIVQRPLEQPLAGKHERGRSIYRCR